MMMILTEDGIPSGELVRKSLVVLTDCAGQSMFLDGSDGQGERTTRSRAESEVGRRRVG